MMIKFNKLRKQATLFFYALSFFSRVPVPKWVDFRLFPFNLGNTYFPLVGLLYGSFAFLVFYVAQLFFNTTISCFFMLIAGILFTGAFHEDGFADCCDGFGGGYNKEQRLLIMKDSQIGTYGGIGLILLFAAKFYLLFSLTEQGLTNLFIALLVSAVLSRFSTLLVMQFSHYARVGEPSKGAATSQALPKSYFITATIMTSAVLVLLPIDKALLLMIVVAFVTFGCRQYFYKQIDGYTGDCLGCMQQLNELFILLFFVSISL